MAVEDSAWSEKEGLSHAAIDFPFSYLVSGFHCSKTLFANGQLFQEIQITFFHHCLLLRRQLWFSEMGLFPLSNLIFVGREKASVVI